MTQRWIDGDTDGLRNVIELRTHLLHLLQHGGAADQLAGKALDRVLRMQIRGCFGMSHVRLKRISWDSATGAELDAVAEAEAVHPTDRLWRFRSRFGPGRRCFALHHSSEPQTPLAVLHVALAPRVAPSMGYINGHLCEPEQGDMPLTRPPTVSLLAEARTAPGATRAAAGGGVCATFWSVSNRFAGLKGIGVPRHLIYQAATHLLETGTAQRLGTLSPVPLFAKWLHSTLAPATALCAGGQAPPTSGLLELDRSEGGLAVAADLLAAGGALEGNRSERLESLARCLCEPAGVHPAWLEVRPGRHGSPSVGAMAVLKWMVRRVQRTIAQSAFRVDGDKIDPEEDGGRSEQAALDQLDQSEGVGAPLSASVREEKWSLCRDVLPRLCAQYLVECRGLERPRCPVAAFHNSNGAILWRVNWMANVSSRGAVESVGMMVNYSYDPVTLPEFSEAFARRTPAEPLPFSSEVAPLLGEASRRLGISLPPDETTSARQEPPQDT